MHTSVYVRDNMITLLHTIIYLTSLKFSTATYSYVFRLKWVINSIFEYPQYMDIPMRLPNAFLCLRTPHSVDTCVSLSESHWRKVTYRSIECINCLSQRSFAECRPSREHFFMFTAVSPGDINNLKHKWKKIKQPKISTYLASFKESS